MSDILITYQDKIKGILIGVSLGDSLGAPHEFRYNKLEYTGTLLHEVRLFNRFHGETIFPIGNVTDDTQMTLTVATQIIKDEGYDENNVVLAYEQWAKSSKMLGKNTKGLFKGVTTYSGYKNRYNKQFSVPMEQWTQSNGSLMRCSPFVIFKGYEELIADTKLTNPHPVNIECSILYIYIMRNLLILGSLPDIDKLFNYAQQDSVIQVLNDVKNKVDRNISDKSVKGWVCTAIYCTLYSIYYIEDVTVAFKTFIEKGGDTDTNAAILGGLYGAKLGYTGIYNLYSNNNNDSIETLLKNNNILKDIDIVSSELYNMFIKLNFV